MASWKKILTASPAMGDLATGTPGSGNYLRGDGSWAAIPAGSDTTYSISAVDSGDNAIFRLTAGGSGSGNDDITFVAGTGITITPSGDNITIANSSTNTDTFRTVTAGGNTLGATETLAFTEGSNISISESGGAVTIAATDTNNNVNVSNLEARLPQITNSVTIGDATDVTVTTSGDFVVTGDLTVNGDTTTLNVANLLVEDKVIEVATGTGGGTNSGASGAGLQVNTGNSTQEPTIKWNNVNSIEQWALQYSANANSLPIATVQVETTTGSPSGLLEYGGFLAYNSADGDLYFYDAT